jgi:RNA polymerase-binding transcription factor
MKKANGPANGLENYRELLLAKKAGLLASLRAQLDALAGPGATTPDDQAPVFYDQFVALQVNRLDFQQLNLVGDALDRMDREDYGICLNCGDPISDRRLRAIPWALHCIVCQERLSAVSGPAQPAEVVA